MLSSAGADHDQQDSPLQRESLITRSAVPPSLILLEKGGWIDDVVMVVDGVEEALNKGVWMKVSVNSCL